MKRLTNFSKTTMSTAMAAVLTLTLSMCPAVDPLDHNVLLPNPADCSSFYSCNNGVAILMHCPDGLYFNDELEVCDWPQNVNCLPKRYLEEVKYQTGSPFTKENGECVRTFHQITTRCSPVSWPAGVSACKVGEKVFIGYLPCDR